jgi:hypothetical protein
VATIVFTKTWSERPMRVVGSYMIVLCLLLVMMKSIHDLSSPLLNVVQAGGPGYRPFRICQPYYSHMSINHGARLLVYLSSLSRVVLTSSIFGDKFAILVFQSPHITVVSYCGKHPIISSTRLLAIVSSIPLFCWLYSGGR